MRKLIFILSLLTSSVAYANELLLVSNVKLSDKQLSIPKLKNLYLGTPLLDGIQPIQLTVEHPVRSRFNGLVLGMTEARIASFWAQMRFSGTRFPPKEFATEDELFQYMQNNDKVIGYVPVNTSIPDNFYVVMGL